MPSTEEYRPELSVVVPIYNEESNLEELHRRIAAALEEVCRDFEIVMVDDGSRDASPRIIEELHRRDPRVRLVALSRNFGKEAALLAAYDHARGRAVVSMDADLQNPPELLPEMLERWRAGAQIVDTVRVSTQGRGWIRGFASWGFYRLMSWLGEVEMTPNAADFRLLDGEVVDHLCRLRERSRFNRGLVRWLGFRREVLEFSAAQRRDGGSRWSTLRLLLYAVDAVVAFSPAPLRFAGLFGLVLSIVSFAYMLSIWYVRIFVGLDVPGYATLVGGIFLLGGVQLISIWLLGEYVARISQEVKQRPVYVVAKTLGIEASDPDSDPDAG
jgi:glycosyltransferase involved in cell wall biosynthesis